jgi:hypothetical protein
MEYIRFLVLVCHRRFGKTIFGVNHINHAGWKNPLKNPQYAYIAPTYSQAKRIAWDYFKDYTRCFPGTKANKSELTLEIPRPHMEDIMKVYLLGAESADNIRGMYLDGAVLDEYAMFDPTIWGTIIRPTLSDRLGWGIFVSTPKGMNHYYDLLLYAQKMMAEITDYLRDNPDKAMGDVDDHKKSWAAKVYKASETGIIAQSELDAARAELSKEEYAQEYECDFTASLMGAYYNNYIEEAEKDERITNVPYDPAVSVFTFWDLGIRDAMAIWFIQFVGKERHVIDYYEATGKDVRECIGVLQKRPYVYGGMYLPHDANATEYTTGTQRVDVFRQLVTYPVYVVAKTPIADGIESVRRILPMCWFDRVKCDQGIKALRHYHKEYDTKKKIFSNSPKHDWSSHGADAFRTFATSTVGNFGMSGMRNRFTQKELTCEYGYDMFGL